MFKKLTPAEREAANTALRDLVELVNTDDLDGERAKLLGRDLRVKKITKWKREDPPRQEATFAADGRIVWRLDKKTREVVFVYIGGHDVLNKK